MRYLILLFLVFFCGCIGDGPGDSGGVCRERFVIDFRYRFSATGELLDDVRVVDIYVFDSRSGVLVDILRVGRESLVSGRVELSLLPGEYSFVAWGASSSDLSSGGYVTFGESHDSFRLSLLDPGSFAQLYYARADNVLVRSDRAVVVPLDFIRHTNLLRVTLRGFGSAVRGVGGPAVFVTGRQGLYTSEGGIHPDAVSQVFHPAEAGVVNGEAMEFAIPLVRLDKDFHTQYPVLLHVERDGVALIDPQDIVKLLLKTPAYNVQDDFDRAYEHTIDVLLNASKLDLTITVNGFVIVLPKAEF